MIAKIEFTIYQDYEQYITEGGENCEYEYDYSKALAVLNEKLTNLVSHNELVFTYAGKQVDIVLPVEMNDTGNIFGEDDCCEGACWEGVNISCEIDCDPYDFDSSKLVVDKCPCGYDPKCILW